MDERVSDLRPSEQAFAFATWSQGADTKRGGLISFRKSASLVYAILFRLFGFDQFSRQEVQEVRSGTLAPAGLCHLAPS